MLIYILLHTAILPFAKYMSKYMSFKHNSQIHIYLTVGYYSFHTDRQPENKSLSPSHELCVHMTLFLISPLSFRGVNTAPHLLQPTLPETTSGLARNCSTYQYHYRK